MKKPCAVRGCRDTTSTRHKFSYLSPSQFYGWLGRLMDMDLYKLPPNEILRKRKAVCGRHFSDKCKLMDRSVLRPGSLPTLFLPGWRQCFSCPDFVEEEAKLTDVASEHNYCAAPVSSVESSITVPAELDGEIFAHSISPETLPTSSLSGTAIWRHLRRMGVTKLSDLTPRVKHLYKVSKSAMNRVKEIKKKYSSLRCDVKKAKKCLDSKIFAETFYSMNNITFNFLKSQLRNSKCKPKGRRYTRQDKVLALSIYKRSPKGYTYMRQFFSLPSRSLLKKMLQNIPLTPGLNVRILNNLKSSVVKMITKDPRNRFCTLMFDEMALAPGISYDYNTDMIIGVCDDGFSRTGELADHVMVFMLRGLFTKWKQPISFAFSSDSMGRQALKNSITELIAAVQDVGLSVVAIICDQGKQNQPVIEELLQETNAECLSRGEINPHLGFLVGGQEIVPIFDPPHLLKCVRNNLLVKDISFTDVAGVTRTASWRDILATYRKDEEILEHRILPKLTAQHVEPNKIKKMKVKCAAQVFSRSVSAAIRFILKMQCKNCNQTNVSKKLENLDEVHLRPNAIDTAEFVLFMDKIFDSVNSSILRDSQPLKSAVTKKSCHLEHWGKAIEVFKSIQQLNSDRRVKCFSNWVVTLKSLRWIFNKLSREGFKYLLTRGLNQDPLENFFGQIRSHGAHNFMPNCYQFMASFKTLVINNFMAQKSVHRNCEQDNSICIDDFSSFISCPVDENAHVSKVVPHLVPPSGIRVSKALNSSLRAYVCGFLAKRIIRMFRNCKECKRCLVSNTVLPEHDWIVEKAFTPRALIRPTTVFSIVYGRVVSIVVSQLPNIYNDYNLRVKLYDLVFKNCDLSLLKCSSHDLASYFVKKTVELILFTFCKNVNRLLQGKDNHPFSAIAEIKAVNNRFKYISKYRK